MNNKDYEVIQALRRVGTFASAHAAEFPAGGKAAEGFARVAPLLTQLGKEDLGRGVPASPATGAKSALLEELWEDLKAISSTARTIARDEPGFAADFQLGEDSQRGILAAAETFLTTLDAPGPETPALVAKFVAYDLPAGFVADLKADLETITGKAEEQTDDLLSATGDTARNRGLIAEGRDLLKRLDTSVRNRFRHNAEVLAQWRAAARIHRPARPEAPPATAPDPVTPAAPVSPLPPVPPVT
ncbi:MAG: hypothetical protein V4726_17620 [Verrucomicrobiota bacterium]